MRTPHPIRPIVCGWASDRTQIATSIMLAMKLTSTMLVSLAIASVASACNIPVFRYALERWRPDQPEVIVFHDSPISTEQEEQLARLGQSKTGIDARAKAKIIRSDLRQPTAPYHELWSELQSHTDASLPYVVVRTKINRGKVVNGWHGPLDQLGQSGALDSPARAELAQRLLAGHAIVWLMIRSSDEQRNEAARNLVKGKFRELSSKIQLPEGIGLPGSELYSEIPLLLRFSILEIDRSDPKERFVTELLSGFQPEAVSRGEPLLVPVFGRGRALEVIPAGDLNGRLMEDLTVFLSGACSCQVKDQNPGFDLWLSVDWDTELFGEEGVLPPARTTRDRERPTLLTVPPGK